MAKTSEPKMSSEDKKWRAESDLSTLIEAKKIQSDPERLKMALAKRDERMAGLKALGTKDSK